MVSYIKTAYIEDVQKRDTDENIWTWELGSNTRLEKFHSEEFYDLYFCLHQLVLDGLNIWHAWEKTGTHSQFL